jgi:hypothetical protein
MVEEERVGEWTKGQRPRLWSCGDLLDGRPRWSENSDKSRTASLAGLMGLRGLARTQCEPRGRESHARLGRELGAACCMKGVGHGEELMNNGR